MAILDERTEFADATALNTGAAGTYNIGDLIDSTVVRDLGNGQPIYLVVSVATGITVAASTGTVAFRLVSDSTDTISTTTATVHVTSQAHATSTTAIPAGRILFVVALPWEGAVYERYLALQQITGTTAVNAGAVDAYLTLDPPVWKAYPDAL